MRTEQQNNSPSAPAPVYAAYAGSSSPPVHYEVPANPPVQRLGSPPSEVPMHDLYRPIPHENISRHSVTNVCLAYLYISVAIILAILSIVVVLFPPWVHYCDYDIRLVDCSDKGGNSRTLSQAVSDNCHPAVHECGDNCVNFERLKDAGTIMNALGAIAMVFAIVSALRMLLLILRPSLGHSAILLRITLFVASLLWVIGMSVYLAHYEEVRGSYSQASMKAGLILAIIIAVLYVASCVLGNFVIRKVAR